VIVVSGEDHRESPDGSREPRAIESMPTGVFGHRPPREGIEGDERSDRQSLKLEADRVEPIALRRPVAEGPRFVAASFNTLPDPERTSDREPSD
jgi:hypothetical protein